MVAIFMLATAVGSLDNNLLSPNMTQIAEDFQFDRDQRDWKLGGELACGYFIMGAPVALVAGHFADRQSRRNLLALVLVLGKVPCLLIYFVRSYRQLFVLRTLMGITLGALTPLTSSLAGDLFPASSRAAAVAMWAGLAGVGALGGQVMAGLVGPSYGWRTPFAVAAIPALLVTGLVLVTAEPERGRHEEALQSRYQAAAVSGDPFVYRQSMTWTKARAVFGIPTNVLGFLQGLPGCVPWGVIVAYLNDYMAQDKGLTVEAATLVLAVFGVGCMVGGIGGGVLGQRLYNRRKAYLPLFMGLSTLLGVGPMLYLINAEYGGAIEWVYIMAFLAGMTSTVSGSNIRAVLVNVNAPETRGTVFGFFCIMDDVGKGFGPFLAAALISRYGRRRAFSGCTWLWALCAAFLLGIAFTIERDEFRLQQRLARDDNTA
jgi:MFS family permease